MTLSTPIEQLARIGPVYQKRLKRLGIKQARDLLFHFPHRYEDFSNIIPIAKIKINENCCLQGKILEIKNSRTWKKRMFLTQAVVGDKSGAIKVVWFNQPYLTNTLQVKDNVCLAGKATLAKDGLCLSNPTYEKIGETGLTHTGRIIPIYPETERLSSRWLRFVIKSLLTTFGNEIKDPLPEKIIKQYQLLAIRKAIWQIHFPDSLALAKKRKKDFPLKVFFIYLYGF